MIRRPPRSTRTDTLFPYTTLFRSSRTAMPITRVWASDGLRSLSIGRIRQHIPKCWKPSFRSTARASAIWLEPHIPNDTIRRSEEHTSELQSLMRISYAVFCLKKKTTHYSKLITTHQYQHTIP